MMTIAIFWTRMFAFKLPSLALVGLCLGAGTAVAGSNWKGTIECSYGSGALNIQIDDKGRVSGGMTNGTIRAGALSGSSITFSYSNAFGNGGVFSGSVSGNSMSGTYTQSAGTAETCTWRASLSGKVTVVTKKPNAKDKAREREIAEAKGLVERAKIVQRQPGCESQRYAAQLLADASVIYRRLGMAGNSDKINNAADKLTGEGGTYYRCLAKRTPKRRNTARAAKPSTGTPEQHATGKKLSVRDCIRNRMQLDELRKHTKDPADIAAIERARQELKYKHGCRV